MEEHLKVTDFVERFKLAVVTANPTEWVPRLFPQWVPSGDESEDDLDLGDTEGEWVFEESEVTPEEAERVLQEMTADTGGTIGFDDLPPDEGWDQW